MLPEMMDDTTFDNWSNAVAEQDEGLCKPDWVPCEELEKAVLDGVMGIPNAREMGRRLRELQQAESKNLGFILIDGNGFGEINNRCGHIAGDGYLQRLAALLRVHLDLSASEIYRYGGDEVLIILRQVRSKDDLVVIGERLQKIFVGGGEIGGINPVVPTISIGAEWLGPDDKLTVEQAVKHADMAMYCAKQQAYKQSPVELRVNDGPSIFQAPSAFAVFEPVHATLFKEQGTTTH